jgi:hypothetical protein
MEGTKLPHVGALFSHLHIERIALTSEEYYGVRVLPRSDVVAAASAHTKV